MTTAESTASLDWRDATCRQFDPDLWFPEKGERNDRVRAICAQCPLVDVCLQYALDNDERYGIWGGKTPQERRKMVPPSVSMRIKKARERDLMAHRIRGMASGGWTDPEIARAVELSEQTIGRIRKEYGIAPGGVL